MAHVFNLQPTSIQDVSKQASKVSRNAEVQHRMAGDRLVVNRDVGHRRKYLVPVTPVVVLRMLTILQFQFEAIEDCQYAPAQLQQGVTFARTQGAERQQRVLQFSSGLVECGVDEPVVLELLWHKQQLHEHNEE